MLVVFRSPNQTLKISQLEKMQLQIARITDVADLKYLAPIEFAAFVEDGGHNVMLGLNTPSSINATIERQKKEFTFDSANFWIKVVDADANNRIVAASNWKIFPTYVRSQFEEKEKQINAMTIKDLSFMNDEKRQEDGVIAVKGFMSARHRNAREAHIGMCLVDVFCVLSVLKSCSFESSLRGS